MRAFPGSSGAHGEGVYMEIDLCILLSMQEPARKGDEISRAWLLSCSGLDLLNWVLLLFSPASCACFLYLLGGWVIVCLGRNRGPRLDTIR